MVIQSRFFGINSWPPGAIDLYTISIQEAKQELCGTLPEGDMEAGAGPSDGEKWRIVRMHCADAL